jgi:hypothetical protein
MKKIIRLTESDLTRIVRRVINENIDYLINESISSSDGNYRLSVSGGFIKDNLGKTMCVKVVAPWPTGTFAQGIDKVWKNSDGSGTIKPHGSKIGNIPLSKDEVDSVLAKLKSGGTYTTKRFGAKIHIGKSLVSWCKKEWRS